MNNLLPFPIHAHASLAQGKKGSLLLCFAFAYTETSVCVVMEDLLFVLCNGKGFCSSVGLAFAPAALGAK